MVIKYLGVLFTVVLLSGCGNGPLVPASELNGLISGSNSPTANVNMVTSDDETMLNLINQLRAQSGVGPLTINAQLQSDATTHSAYMDSTDTLVHSDASAYDGSFDASGENIACGNEDPTATFEQWKNSPGHLANMISPNYQFIGIARGGTTADASQKSCPWYWTTDFGGN